MFFIKFFGYNGSNQREKHPTLIGLLRKAMEEITMLKGNKEPLVTFLAHSISQHTMATILDQRI